MSFSLNPCLYSLLPLYFSQVFVVTVWSVELYMVPLALLVLFAYNFSLVTTGKVNNTQDAQASNVSGSPQLEFALEQNVMHFNGMKPVA